MPKNTAPPRRTAAAFVVPRHVNRYALVSLLALFSSTGCDADKPPRLPKHKPAEVVEAPADVPLADVWRAGALTETPVTVPMAVYAMPHATEDVEAAARAVAAKHASDWPQLTLDERDAGKRGVFIDVPAMDTFAPPDAETLKYFGRGLSAAQVEGVQASKKVVVLWFVTNDAAEAATMVAEAQVRTGEVASRSGGLVWDEITRELFSQEAWAERTATPPAATPSALSKHFTVHMYRDDTFARLVTLGLSKFGLPELAVEGVTPSDAERMNQLVNALAAAMLATPAVGPDGAVSVTGKRGTVSLELGVGTHQDGDLAGPLATIRFLGTGSLQSRHAAVLRQLLGAPNDPLLQADGIEDELEAASQTAKRELAKLKPHFAKGIPDLEHLSVKGPFATDDGGTEWMWVEVTRWEGNTLTGILLNTPFHVRALREGATVSLEADAVFDYIHKRADGTEAGGATNTLLQRQQQRE